MVCNVTCLTCLTRALLRGWEGSRYRGGDKEGGEERWMQEREGDEGGERGEGGSECEWRERD